MDGTGQETGTNHGFPPGTNVQFSSRVCMELLVQDLAAGLLSMAQMAQLWQTNDELVYVCQCVCVLGSAEEEGQSGQLSGDMGASK